MKNCRHYLDAQIDVIRPRVISPRRARASGERFSITKQRGQWFEGPFGIPVTATFHRRISCA